MTTSDHSTMNDFTGLLNLLAARFAQNPKRHTGLKWEAIAEKLRANNEKLWSLQQMEDSGGEPDVIVFDKARGEYLFVDCSAESPAGRRSLCYDHEALESRKANKPVNSATTLAAEMGIEVLDEAQYRELQQLGPFDTKTSSWLHTPDEVRKLGGAIFGDYRFGRVFIYHNGADSYYGARGFRGLLRV